MSDDEFKLVPPPDNSGSSKRTPMMQQFMEAKAKEPEAILFFRMGDFYEMFYEDALTAAPILDITLTTRDRKSDNPVPMAGIPYHALDNYIGKMIDAGHRVAICEQVEDPRLAKGLVKREITRVVTPGTLIEDNLLESRENNYLCSVAEKKGAVATAFADLSTGDFQISIHQGEDRWRAALEDLRQMQPREIIHPDELELPGELLENAEGKLIHGQDDWWFGPDYCEEILKKQLNVASLDAFELDHPAMLAAAGGAIQYIEDVQRSSLLNFTDIRRLRQNDVMLIDEVSRRNLELLESWMTGDKKDSLLGLIDKTATSMGARLLRHWLLRPLLHLEQIEARLDAVEALLRDTVARRDLERHLRSIADIERLMTRVTMGSANARDLAALRKSFEQLPDIREVLAGSQAPLLKQALDDLDPMEDMRGLIANTLVEEPPLQMKEGGLIADGANEELDELRHIVKDNKGAIADIEQRERAQTGISNLRVKYNKVFGYYIEVSRGNLKLVPDNYFRKQTLVNAERFITPELKEFESKVLNAQDRIKTLEYELFVELREAVAAQSRRINSTGKALARLDVVRNLAEVAAQFNYSRPKVNDGTAIEIKAGRHPVVERLRIEEQFIANDCVMDSSGDRILIITGPNMGGKSTFLRQVALISILAQMGSFVPAESAEIGMIDRIFTRIGASDYLAKGHSTFMVEMSETANILRNASSKSLIILDEVGRGTSTFDGLSIAWSVVEYINSQQNIRAKTLFATHYHELTELERTLEGVRNYNVAAREHGDEVIFLRTIVAGPSDQSYGIQVAKLAGMPEAVIKRAREILARLKADEFTSDGRPRLTLGKSKPKKEPTGGEKEQAPPGEMALAVQKMLSEVDIDAITPLQALRLLNELKEKLNGGSK